MKTAAGFTLMELLIVVVIASIIAAIAIPFYGDYVRKAKRTDAQSELLALANEQEKRFPNQNTYTANLADLGLETDFTPKGLYALKATISASGDTFLITAKPVPGKSQADDVECLEISINSVNQRLPAVCWGG